eukprot:2134563-Amphidinium_carterae.1
MGHMNLEGVWNMIRHGANIGYDSACIRCAAVPQSLNEVVYGVWANEQHRGLWKFVHCIACRFHRMLAGNSCIACQ